MKHEMPYTKANVMYITGLMLLGDSFGHGEWDEVCQYVYRNGGKMYQHLQDKGYITVRNGGPAVISLTPKMHDWLANVPEDI